MSAIRFLALVAAYAAAGAGFAQGTVPQTVPAPPLAITPAVDDAPTKAHSYDWMARHQGVLDRIRKGPVDLLLVGDSITHGWGGEPADPGPPNGQKDLWDRYFAPRDAVNEGFGWDRTEHVLWRFQNGELDNIHPKVAVVMIGTNNMWRDSPDDIATGITEIVREIHKKSRRTKILLLGIFPRGHDANTPDRQKITAVNAKIAGLAKERYVTYLDLGDKFLESDGTIAPETMRDFLHPTHHGYEIWAAAMEPILSHLMGDSPK
jgi:beta-glucosidase